MIKTNKYLLLIISLITVAWFYGCMSVVLTDSDNDEPPTYFTEFGRKDNNKIDSTISGVYEGYKINKILIEGNTYTRDKVIRREIELIPSNKYSRILAIRSVKKLYCLNYFEEVQIKIELNTNNTVNCIFIVREKPPISRTINKFYCG